MEDTLGYVPKGNSFFLHAGRAQILFQCLLLLLLTWVNSDYSKLITEVEFFLASDWFRHKLVTKFWPMICKMGSAGMIFLSDKKEYTLFYSIPIIIRSLSAIVK